jgi:hypothetical protein
MSVLSTDAYHNIYFLFYSIITVIKFIFTFTLSIKYGLEPGVLNT